MQNRQLARVPSSSADLPRSGSQLARVSIAQCPVELPPRALRWALGWIEGVANPLTSIVQVLAGSFGWSFLMAGPEAEGDHSQHRQQNSHCVFVLCAPETPERN